jgi:hypothetical protein
MISLNYFSCVIFVCDEINRFGVLEKYDALSAVVILFQGEPKFLF